MRRHALILAGLVLLAGAAGAQTWYLNVEEPFDGSALPDGWTGWVAPGDPCGYVNVGGGMLSTLSQCGCGYDSPAPTVVQHDLELPDDWRLVIRMNKATSCGWTKVLLAREEGGFPSENVVGLYLNGTGVGGAYGSVSLRLYQDGSGVVLDGMEYSFGIDVWNVWVLTKEGDALSLDVGPTEESVTPLLAGADASMFDGGYLTLESSQAGALTHVDWVKIHSHEVVASETASWGEVKRLYR